MSEVPHIADGEKKFTVKAVTPDFCRVGSKIVPFFPVRELTIAKDDYAKSVFARGHAVLMVDSIVAGTKSNAGRGVNSKVSKREGHVKVICSNSNVVVEGRRLARHNDQCLMNCQVDPVPTREEDILEVKE